MKTIEEYVLGKIEELEKENKELREANSRYAEILELIHKHGRIDDDGMFTAIPLCITKLDTKDNQILCDWLKSWGERK